MKTDYILLLLPRVKYAPSDSAYLIFKGKSSQLVKLETDYIVNQCDQIKIAKFL